MLSELKVSDKNRIRVLDIAKGIGVFLVIAGHMPSVFPERVRLWIFSFHMPLFFLISGYFAYVYVTIDDVWKATLRKIPKLLVPYLIYSLIYSVILNYAEPMPLNSLLTHMIKILNGTQEGVQWFLLCLFWVSVMFAWLTFVVKNPIHRAYSIFGIALIGLLLGRYGTHNYLRFGSACYSLGFYYLGYLWKTYKERVDKVFRRFKFFIVPTVLIIELAVLILNVKILDLMPNFEIDILINYLVAVSGCSIILFASGIMDRLNYLGYFLAYVGRFSLYFYPLTNYIPYFMGKILGESNLLKLVGYVLGFAVAFLCSMVQLRWVKNEK